MNPLDLPGPAFLVLYFTLLPAAHSLGPAAPGGRLRGAA